MADPKLDPVEQQIESQIGTIESGIEKAKPAFQEYQQGVEKYKEAQPGLKLSDDQLASMKLNLGPLVDKGTYYPFMALMGLAAAFGARKGGGHNANLVALKTFTAANKGFQQGRVDATKRQMEQFKIDFEAAKSENELKHKQAEQILTDANLTLDSKLKELTWIMGTPMKDLNSAIKILEADRVAQAKLAEQYKSMQLTYEYRMKMVDEKTQQIAATVAKSWKQTGWTQPDKDGNSRAIETNLITGETRESGDPMKVWHPGKQGSGGPPPTASQLQGGGGGGKVLQYKDGKWIEVAK